MGVGVWRESQRDSMVCGGGGERVLVKWEELEWAEEWEVESSGVRVKVM